MEPDGGDVAANGTVFTYTPDDDFNGVDTFPETPEDMAAQVKGLIEAGANIIGGCCGTTPDHIKAMKEAIAQ